VSSAAAGAAAGIRAQTGSDAGFELAWTRRGEPWASGGSVQTTATTQTVGSLENCREYVFRVRDLDDDDGWSTVEIAKPQDRTPCPDLLHTTFDDVTLTAGEQVTLDMADYFSGDHFTYTAKVTTTNQTSGKVRTGPLNVIARNKIAGTWTNNVLTLTAGTADPQTLTIDISAYDIFTNATISDGFDVILAEEQSHPPETPEVPEEPETPEQPEPPETPETAPGVPAQPSVSTDDGSVTVNWAAPGGAVDSYDLDIALKGQGWNSGPPMVTGLSGTSHTVTGLTNGTDYAFRVRATNTAGSSSWSATAYAQPSE